MYQLTLPSAGNQIEMMMARMPNKKMTKKMTNMTPIHDVKSYYI